MISVDLRLGHLQYQNKNYKISLVLHYLTPHEFYIYLYVIILINFVL